MSSRPVGLVNKCLNIVLFRWLGNREDDQIDKKLKINKTNRLEEKKGVHCLSPYGNTVSFRWRDYH